jgi:hypothetical protein
MQRLLKRSERPPSLRRMEGDLRRRDKLIRGIADSFFSESPFQRMLKRCGRARKQMQAYRRVKMIRRPRRFRQDVW